MMVSKLTRRNKCAEGGENGYVRTHNSPGFSGPGLISFPSSSTRRAWRFGRSFPIVPLLRTASSRGKKFTAGNVSVRPYLTRPQRRKTIESVKLVSGRRRMGYVPLSEPDLSVAEIGKPREDLLDKAISQGCRTRNHHPKRAHIEFFKCRME
jgi:hypothetical protein